MASFKTKTIYSVVKSILVISTLILVTSSIVTVNGAETPKESIHEENSDTEKCKVYGQFEKGYKSVSVTEGEKLKIFCTVNESDVTMTWKKNGQELNLTALDLKDSRIKIDKLGFSISEANKSDAGVYECTAKLKDGSKNPCRFEFLARVKGTYDFLLPLFIIIGQCVLLGLITGFCHWREKRKEAKEKETPFEDKYKPIHSDSDSE